MFMSFRNPSFNFLVLCPWMVVLVKEKVAGFQQSILKLLSSSLTSPVRNPEVMAVQVTGACPSVRCHTSMRSCSQDSSGFSGSRRNTPLFGFSLCYRHIGVAWGNEVVSNRRSFGMRRVRGSVCSSVESTFCRCCQYLPWSGSVENGEGGLPYSRQDGLEPVAL